MENEDLEALLDEDRCQTLEQSSDALSVTEMAVIKRLHNLGQDQKAGNWIPHELSERQLEKRKMICELLVEWYELWLAMNTRFIMETPNDEKHGYCQANQVHQR